MKKVRFSNVIVIHILDDTEEDRNSSTFHLDRWRFQKKIENVELLLNEMIRNKIKKIFFDVLPRNVL